MWLLLLPFTFLTMIICYITNPLVVLFADDVGELHGFLHLWQTWDDSLDGSFQVSCMPKFLQYDFTSKYDEHSVLMEEYNRIKYYVTLRPGATFSTWEYIQRYFCRLGWLTRNCAYGFSFYYAGVNIIPAEAKPIEESAYHLYGYCGDRDDLWFDTPWTYQDSRREFSVFGFNVYRNFYLGWKFQAHDTETKSTRVMVANRIAWKIRRGEPQEGLL